ncbi:MAG: bacteriohemerythrin [Magnetococcales bacterium]|nr:bacteriohemerythrin [Magnetococcales bacterium]
MDKIIKVPVIKGVFWVEIPDAKLQIICGCPADCVKHLMKRGLIIQREVEGVLCETGPNAILLSDVMIQNGEFSNLAEFPVLQMLYKQGLIIPKHPNNTGQKPLLIGLGEQVQAQMQYIFRGNYGLVSLEEIRQGGVDEETAKQMMRLKKRFAFGQIKPSSLLLDSCVLGMEKREIRNGVTIERIAVNQFEISYHGDTVTVDLNLQGEDHYDPPYPLGFQSIPRDYFSVIHSGDGDGWDVNRPSMSSIVLFQGKIYLIDAGPNLFFNLTALGVGINEIEGIFHTHAHDDHFAGITSLMRSGHKIKYYAAALVRLTVEKKLAALLSMEENQFQDFFDCHDLPMDQWTDIQGLEVMPVFSPHPLETTNFLFRTLWSSGYKTYGHFADIVSLNVLEGMVTEDDDVPGVKRAFFEKVKKEYLVPLNLKKLDVGGGMIHGAAEDFRNDKSERIVLAHTSVNLTPSEKAIGSSAPFGISDVLISGQNDFARRLAFQFLQSHFSRVPFHHLRMLLNNEVVAINPGAIILKEGDCCEDVLLILTGLVEKIFSGENRLSRLMAGTLLGEDSALKQTPSPWTFRAASYVSALKISAGLYRQIIQKNDLMGKIERTATIRAFLESIDLLCEGLSHPVMAGIIDNLVYKTIASGSTVPCQDSGFLHVIRRGKMRRLIGTDSLDVLEVGHFFGEEGAIFGVPCLYHVMAEEETEILQIRGDLLADIPIVRWKLFEMYKTRAMQSIYSSDSSKVFYWRDEFGTGIASMDAHHKELFGIANNILNIIRFGQRRDELIAAMESLVVYTQYHFDAEEQLLVQHGFPNVDHHRDVHRTMARQVQALQETVFEGKYVNYLDFLSFLQTWLVQHLLKEDRSYGSFLHAKGVS